MSNGPVLASCTIESKVKNEVLDVWKGDPKYSGHSVGANPPHGGVNQLWDIVEKPDGDVMLISRDTGNALAAWPDKKYSGCEIGSSRPQGRDNQLWKIEGDYDDCVIRCKHNGHVLDHWSQDSAYTGHRVGCNPFHGRTNQRWKIDAKFDVEILSFEYQRDLRQILESEPEALYSETCDNPASTSVTSTVSQTFKKTKSNTWTFESSMTNKLWWKVGAKVGVLSNVASGEFGGEHSITIGASHSKTQTTERTFEVKKEFEVPGRSRKTITMTASKKMERIPFRTRVKRTNTFTRESVEETIPGTWHVDCYQVNVNISEAIPLPQT
eukprot:CAMPEP_0114642614 /NCGR_PEP_ID=MMETSP0191-20121206/2922_1 /TAXON_ID=126664 /ORGANISM="Sorites sp." /LENGTH=324 /DNA_ID=CAMNT_0001854809 /DNA_START=57 /DNA_END=1031 /DNA_ORIENTATION=-